MALNKKTSEEKDHAVYSASGSARWLGCPGSIKLCESAPPEAPSKYAAEGTAAHACLEFLLKNRANPAAARKSAWKNSEWDADMVNHAIDAITWIESRLAIMPGAVLLTEQRVDASPFTCDGQFGTLDVALVHEFGRLVVIDYKYGAGIAVDPVDGSGKANSQLVYYALGQSFEFHHNFSEVELVVIQPRAYHESGERVRSHVMTMDELLAWVPVFQGGVFDTKMPKAKLASGSWCRFCPAATICPELKGRAMQQAQITFSDDTGVESVPEPKSIQIPKLGTMLEAADRLEDWIRKVREHAVHVLERGEEIPGFKLVAKKSPRRWKDADKAAKDAEKDFGARAFTTPELLSPAQLEKAAKGTKGLDEWVAARTTSESSGTTLASASDKRPAVTTAARVFQAPEAKPPRAVFEPGRAFPVALQGKLVAKNK